MADPYRLPRTVVPSRYDLTLEPDLASATFRGDERVAVTVVEPVREVVVNAIELTIGSAALVAADGRRLEGTVTLDDEHEMATVALDGEAEPGEWTFECSFTGILNDKLRGFYRSTFTGPDGTQQTLATTQFESTDARRAFPCWDEPDLKARFGVTLVVDDGLLAVSNAPEQAREPVDGGRVRITFADTMVMSTYLLAFVVGPLVATPWTDVDGVPLRVVCPPGKEHLADYAIDWGRHSLRWFAEWFGVPYPGLKMDFIAIPDFAAGAMENLGAVTYRESVLLVDPEASSHTELERVADVVCHEVAHMWFGDLVTMRWWHGIWLNEAFATFMELLAVDAYRPEWGRWVTFGTTRGSAMVTDALTTTRPIEFPVQRPDEAEAMFDPLTYQKGGGVLRMLEQYLGAEVFRDGIRRYIADHAYGNTDTADLWAALEASSGVPVGEIMDTWILQGGHPLLTVEPAGDGRVRLHQRRFLFTGGDDPTVWQVPVLWRTLDGGEGKVLLGADPVEVELGSAAPVVVNAGGWGTYRVRYGGGLLRDLLDRLQELDPLERYNLVADTWAATLAGAAPVDDFAALLLLLGEERDPSVWVVVVDALEQLGAVTPEADRDAFCDYAGRVLRPAFEAVGWDRAAGEPETTGTTRALLVRALGLLAADGAVRDRVAGLHRAYLQDRTSVDPDVAGAVVAVTAAAGRAEDFETFVERWRQPATPQEELRFLYGLGQFRDEALVERTLDMLLTDVRSQNAPFLGRYLLENPAGGSRTWAWAKEHWDEIVDRFPPKALNRMVDGVRLLVDDVDDIAAFTATHAPPSDERAISQTVEKLRVLAALRERDGARLGEVFRTA